MGLDAAAGIDWSSAYEPKFTHNYDLRTTDHSSILARPCQRNRALAERSIHPETKRTLQNIAADYERLAQRAEERLQESREEKR
jgi:hypothetical protein